MSTGFACCGSKSSPEGYKKGCKWCIARIRNTAICSDPKCNKWILPKEKDKSNEICQCPENYWFDLKHSNFSKKHIINRKCGACGELCKIINEKPTAFCDKHIQNKPNANDIKHCIVCGTDQNVFSINYPNGVCINEECREVLRNHKF